LDSYFVFFLSFFFFNENFPSALKNVICDNIDGVEAVNSDAAVLANEL
jgi:hypothetical protein